MMTTVVRVKVNHNVEKAALRLDCVFCGAIGDQVFSCRVCA